MEDYLKSTIETYNQIAREYMQNTIDRRPQVEFEDFCQRVVPGGFILDAGCAGGRDCRAFVERGFSVIGIDLSAEMIKLARDIAPRCRLIEADVRQIPLADQKVDGIWCCASLLHLQRDQTVRALREFRRVLKVGGICCVIVKEGSGEEVVEYEQGKPRFFTYFRREEIQKRCYCAGFSLLDEHISSGNPGHRRDGRTQNWISLLMKT
ncbi:MAG TPA: class I SAM-dependent methyltransferase [Ktedonosporobacter sp.]|nr:class I SAM-dependent methyltransferase [Ktedonosporobacter sp.]